MNGTAVPFPQKASRTYELAGSVSTNLALGQFVFAASNRAEIQQCRKGVLYRILAVSFSANCSETEFRQAFVKVAPNFDPMARLTLGGVLIAPKAWPVRAFYASRETLNYFEPSSDNQKLEIAFEGTFEGALIPSAVSLELSYSFTMQELASASFKEAYDGGKF